MRNFTHKPAALIMRSRLPINSRLALSSNRNAKPFEMVSDCRMANAAAIGDPRQRAARLVKSANLGSVSVADFPLAVSSSVEVFESPTSLKLFDNQVAQGSAEEDNLRLPTIDPKTDKRMMWWPSRTNANLAHNPPSTQEPLDLINNLGLRLGLDDTESGKISTAMAILPVINAALSVEEPGNVRPVHIDRKKYTIAYTGFQHGNLF